jgi:hypothetical protein
MAHVYLEARHVLVGDTLWLTQDIAAHHLSGDKVTVVANEANHSMLEFLRDYAENCEGTEIVRSTSEIPNMTGGGCGAPAFNADMTLRLRRELEPIVDRGPYLVFQTESASHGKRGTSIRGLNIAQGARAYSVGVAHEYIVPGSLAWHNRPISDVARLIKNSVGMVAVFSSMALLASLLGVKVVSTGYDGNQIPEGSEPTGFPKTRCVFACGGTDTVALAIVNHIGRGFITGEPE